MQRLLSFNHDSSLYLTPLPASVSHDQNPASGKGHLDPGKKSLSTIQQTAGSRAEHCKVLSDWSAVEEKLLSVVTRLTCFSNWFPDLTLLDLGATSFDIVRIADAVEDQFREYCQLPSLTHVLLTKNLREVVDYVWTELSDGESGGVSDGESGGVSDGESGGVSDSGDGVGNDSFQSRKRGRQEDLEIPSPKREPSPCEPIHVWRRGQVLCNGQ